MNLGAKNERSLWIEDRLEWLPDRVASRAFTFNRLYGVSKRDYGVRREDGEFLLRKLGQSWSELTGSKEAEDIRERVHRLCLKRLNVCEIAKMKGLPKSNVAYHLSIIRKQNVAWYGKNMDPEGRPRAFVKELVDQTSDVVRESWTLYGKALTRLNDVLKTDKNPCARLEFATRTFARPPRAYNSTVSVFRWWHLAWTMFGCTI